MLISPAKTLYTRTLDTRTLNTKTLDINAPIHPALTIFAPTQPYFMTEVMELLHNLQQKSVDEIAKLMKISNPLAELNHQRFQHFATPFNENNATPAIFSFKGDVYLPLRLNEYGTNELAFINQHLRILSGFYGLLRPLDFLYPYRLEMGTKLKIGLHNNLYQFWGDKITAAINATGATMLINLASEEYFKAVKIEKLNAPLVNIAFKERHADGYKTIGVHAKTARGEMVNFMVQNAIEHLEGLKQFNVGGYAFAPQLSSATNYVFVR